MIRTVKEIVKWVGGLAYVERAALAEHAYVSNVTMRLNALESLLSNLALYASPWRKHALFSVTVTEHIQNPSGENMMSEPIDYVGEWEADDESALVDVSDEGFLLGRAEIDRRALEALAFVEENYGSPRWERSLLQAYAVPNFNSRLFATKAEVEKIRQRINDVLCRGGFDHDAEGHACENVVRDSGCGCPHGDRVAEPKKTPTDAHSERDDLAHLSDVEILAHVVGSTAAAKRLLEAAGTLQNLSKWKLSDLTARGGLDVKKAKRVYAAMMAGRRGAVEPMNREGPVQTSFDAFRILSPLIGGERNEKFVVMLLDAKNMVISVRTVSEGTLTMTLVHQRDVFGPPVVEKAAAIIVAHNHPSGFPEPSLEDESLTRRLAKVGDEMGIRLQDHLVIGQGDYVSLRDTRPQYFTGAADSKPADKAAEPTIRELAEKYAKDDLG